WANVTPVDSSRSYFYNTCFLYLGNSIQCYSCQSASDPSCVDPTKLLKTIECNPPATSCFKTHILEADGSTAVERSCVEARVDPCGLTSKIMEYLNGKLLSCEVCDQNLCNGM
ncbi:hypothetical protein C0J52_03035, partial [Blattella germanica]